MNGQWARLVTMGVVAGLAACGSAGGDDPGSRTEAFDGGVVRRVDAGKDSPVEVVSGPRELVRRNPEAFFENDPQAMVCRPGEPPKAVNASELPGGTAECPHDKNREGCRCQAPYEIGEQAPCWPGLRVNRGRGMCRDGTTTCQPFDEFGGAWGACEDAVLPADDGQGNRGCGCFSMGEWDIENVIPCNYQDSQGTLHEHSSWSPTGRVADVTCVPEGGYEAAGWDTKVVHPGTAWSKSRVKVDCAGEFTLCLTLKVGEPGAPVCTLGRSCIENQWIAQPDTWTELDALPAWVGADSDCARRVRVDDASIYGEMTVRGKSMDCEALDDGAGGEFVFHTFSYCRLSCNDPSNIQRADCVACRNGQRGAFGAAPTAAP